MSKAGKITVINNILLLIILMLTIHDFIQFQLILPYNWHKFLHILGVIIFFGNMIVGPVWFVFAVFTNDINIIRFAFRLLHITDVSLTVTGIDLALLNGLILASAYGGIKAQRWLLFAVILLLVTLVLTVPVLYFQEKLYRLSKENETINPVFQKTFILWSITGTLISFPPAIILYLMVFKVTGEG